MIVTLWGTRGSCPAPGPGTVRYGGNTSCVGIRAREDTVTVLDAGTGIRALGAALDDRVRRIDILLTHLHMDHIQGLGFFAPLFRRDASIHIWGPATPPTDLSTQLARYLSPPLFPVAVPELPCDLVFHNITDGEFAVPGLAVTARLVCHTGPTLGYRMMDGDGSLAYLPDHELGLAAPLSRFDNQWHGALDLCRDVDLLIHDAQYTETEYEQRLGWGHSTIPQTLRLADQARVGMLVPFHHDPAHGDDVLDAMFDGVTDGVAVTPAREGLVLEVRPNGRTVRIRG